MSESVGNVPVCVRRVVMILHSEPTSTKGEGKAECALGEFPGTQQTPWPVGMLFRGL